MLCKKRPSAEVTESVPSKNPPSGLLQASVQQWIQKDPAAALNWLGQVPDPIMREQLILSVVNSYAAIYPVQAVAWVNQHAQSKDDLDQAVDGITHTWVARDPKAAGNWIASFKEFTPTAWTKAK